MDITLLCTPFVHNRNSLRTFWVHLILFMIRFLFHCLTAYSIWFSRATLQGICNNAKLTWSNHLQVCALVYILRNTKVNCLMIIKWEDFVISARWILTCLVWAGPCEDRSSIADSSWNVYKLFSGFSGYHGSAPASGHLYLTNIAARCQALACQIMYTSHRYN